jgi:NAD(P)H dehydrogenase (quinone)
LERAVVDTVLILGGSGTVGARLLDEIRRQGLERRMQFTCAARSEVGARKIQAHGFKATFVDLDEPQSIKAAAHGITTIFLLKPYGMKMLNYAKGVVDAASSAGVRAIVNLSAFGPSSSCIDLLTWHRLVDSYVERSGLSFTHLRPSFFMEGLAARIDREAGVVYDLSGSHEVPWVATADIGRVAATLIADTSRHAGRAYSLVSESWSAPRIAALLSELTGKEFEAAAMDENQAVNGLVARGREPVFARAIVEYGKLAPTFAASGAIGTIEELTGNPAITLRQFLENYLQTHN